MAGRRGGRARLTDELAALFGQLLLRPVVLRPRFPEGKGQDERTVGYLETSFLPLRRFSRLANLQDQHDAWATPSPSNATTAGWGRRSKTRCKPSAATCGPFPTRCPTSIVAARPGS
jgi:hypothetical protein